MAERLANGQQSPRHLLGIAAWIAYTAAAPGIADDPLMERYTRIWAEAGDDLPRLAERFVAELDLFAPALRDSQVFVAALGTAVKAWRSDGPRTALGAAMMGGSA